MLSIKQEGIDPVLWETYRKWLLMKAYFNRPEYELLTKFLHSTDHSYVVETNEDRLATGFTTLWDKGAPSDIRAQFNECSDSPLKFPDYLDLYPIGHDIDYNISCSVLEEMVRIAFSEEEYHMGIWVEDNNDIQCLEYRKRGGKCMNTAIRIDRGPHLFEVFLMNLGLLKYDDSHFAENEAVVDFIVQRWLKREFKYDGTGGIVPVPGTDMDQRVIPLSSQISEYAVAHTFGYCWNPVYRHKRFDCGRE